MTQKNNELKLSSAVTFIETCNRDCFQLFDPTQA